MRVVHILYTTIALLFAFASFGQDVEYYCHDSVFIKIDSSDYDLCMKRSIRRMDKMTLRLQKTNNYYLHLFMHCEDAMLYGLCHVSLDHPEWSISLKPSTPLAIEPMQFGDNDLLLATNSDGNITPKSTLPNTDFQFSDEARADALIQDAWFSFNRFENKCRREMNMPLERSCAEIDTLGMIEQRVGQNDDYATKKSDQIGAFSRSRRALIYEKKRGELIQQYIAERHRQLSAILKDYPGSKFLLLPIQKCNIYFLGQLKEWQSLFCDKSALEREFIVKLFPNTPLDGGLFPPAAPEVSASEFPNKLSIQDLMKKAPSETSHFIDQLKKPTEAIKEIQNETAERIPDKLNELGSIDSLSSIGDSARVNPEKVAKPEKPWKPNPLKVKRLCDRFQFGTNLQVDKRNTFFPSGLTLGANLSFMTHVRSSIGVGVNLIQPLPNQLPEFGEKLLFPSRSGYGLKSFIDFKLYSILFLQAGYERNYRCTSVLNREMNIYESALFGLKLKYPTRNKQSAPTIEILYDALHVKTGQQAIVIRAGMNFNRKHGIKN